MYRVGPKHELRPEPQGRLPKGGTRVCGFSLVEFPIQQYCGGSLSPPAELF
jgi:hypothetical protein